MFGNLISQDSGSRSGKARSIRHLRRLFLERLRRMVATRRDHASRLESGELSLRLLDKALYSTFCDCLDLKVGAEARAILRQGDVSPDEVEEAGPDKIAS